MNECDVLVTSIYILAAATVLYSVNVKCKSDMVDVERHSLRNGVIQWYMFRIAGVIVIFGGLMHGRYLIGKALDSIFFKKKR